MQVQPPALDFEVALRRAIDREQSLLWNLKEVLVALDESAVGPTVAILPRFQVDRIEAAIESSEDELAMLHRALAEVERHTQ